MTNHPLLVLRCAAVLFDMDGTLVDSTLSVERQWESWAARHNFDLESLLALAHGRRTIDTIRDFAPHLSAEEEAARVEEGEVKDREGIEAVAGAAAIIEKLRNTEWAVVTSAGRRLAEARLQYAGLPVPSVLVSCEDVREGKPDPEGYLLAARALKVDPGACVVIEDTPAGLQAGRAAGMRVLALTTTYSVAQLNGAPAIPDFTWLEVERPEEAAHLPLRLLVRRH